MPSSKLDIWNMAIGHIGESIEIATEAENTSQAKACRRYWDTCRQQTLRDAPWPFVKKFVLLAQVTNVVPSTEYKYAYRYPTGCLNLRRILNGLSRIEDMQSRIPFKISADDTGKIILCDMEPVSNDDPLQSAPYAEYTFDETDTTKYDPDLALAMSYQLAHVIGPRIAKDRTKLVDRAFVLYTQMIERSVRNAINEAAYDEQALSEFERARYGSVGASNDDFFRFNLS